MLRRTFFYHSTLGLTGLLSGWSVFTKSILNSPQIQSKELFERKFAGNGSGKVGILRPEAQSARGVKALSGAARMLRDSARDFQMVDSRDDFTPYKVLLLPDGVQFGEDLTAKIEAYLHQGGRMLASYQSGINAEGTAFASSLFGVTLLGHAPFSPDFIQPTDSAITHHLGNHDLVMYLRAMEVQPTTAHVLARASVLHLPTAGGGQPLGTYPAITRHHRVVYFAHPVFEHYAHSAPRWCRQLVANALEMLQSESGASQYSGEDRA